MRLPARIEPWLSTEDLQVRAREAPDKSAYQRRLAIWLTGVCHLPAHRVAESLCVSKQAVWLWITQYNWQGPEGLRRAGRRWAWLSWEVEERFLQERQQAAPPGPDPHRPATARRAEEAHRTARVIGLSLSSAAPAWVAQGGTMPPTPPSPARGSGAVQKKFPQILKR